MAISEAYRSLRAALMMSTASTLEVVSVTSTESGEGKSVTATNLAIVMAQLGKKVLLVDADLRRPRLHKIFSVSNRGGLVSCLTGGVSSLRPRCQPPFPTSTSYPRARFLPIRPSSSPRLEWRNWSTQMRETYDFVVLDSPPVLAVSDPIHIGSVADGMIFCIAAGSTQKDHCVTARDRLELADVKLLGLVLNRYDAGEKGYRRRYYYHYQQYYAQDEAADEAADSAA